MSKFLKQEFLMIIGAILLALPMGIFIPSEVYEINKVVLWIIFWFYMLKSYSIDAKWSILFALAMLIYSSSYIMNYNNNIWAMINGFLFIIAVSWLLKRYRAQVKIA